MYSSTYCTEEDVELISIAEKALSVQHKYMLSFSAVFLDFWTFPQYF